jgi:hypothetical protein
MPCKDNMACTINTTEVIVDATTNHHDNHQHEDEGCSPFCTCACCGQVCYINFQPFNVAVITPSKHAAQRFVYTNTFLPSSLFGNIWQPPKFS